MTREKHDTWQSVEGRQSHRLPEEGAFRVEIKKQTRDDTWQSVEGRQAHRLPEEGVFRVVEAEGLVNDVGLRLHPKTQQGHGFAVLRHELDLTTAKKKTFVCAVGVA